MTYRLYDAAKADSIFVHDLGQVFQWGVRTLLRNHSSINRGGGIINKTLRRSAPVDSFRTRLPIQW